MAMNELHFGATKQSDQGTDQPTFLQWIDEQGIVHNKCKLYCFPRTGRGVKAAVSIKAGEVVLEMGPTRYHAYHACSPCAHCHVHVQAQSQVLDVKHLRVFPSTQPSQQLLHLPALHVSRRGFAWGPVRPVISNRNPENSPDYSEVVLLHGNH